MVPESVSGPSGDPPTFSTARQKYHISRDNIHLPVELEKLQVLTLFCDTSMRSIYLHVIINFRFNMLQCRDILNAINEIRWLNSPWSCH